MAGIRPMLAAKFDNPEDIEPELTFLTYPLLGSPKIDGIRWMKPAREGAKSRSWKDLPNLHFQEFMKDNLFTFLDGEVIVGEDPTAEGLFNNTQSAIMTRDGTPKFSLWVFDHWMSKDLRFKERTAIAKVAVEEIRRRGQLNVNYLEHTHLYYVEDILKYEREALEAGYEGIMLRNPQAPYKYGRSTLKQQGLIKVKRFSDDEATIIGFEALERNTNPDVRNVFGLAKRSHHKVGKIPDNLLGKIIVRTEKWGDFAIGSGFDVATREMIWKDREFYMGKTVSFKYQAHGTKDKPRMPIFKGFRED